MKGDKNTNISVRTVFIGRRSAEQVFIDLIRSQHNNVIKSASSLEPMAVNNQNTAVFPTLRETPQIGATL